MSSTAVWWSELEVLLVAYSGLRSGEHAALTAGQIDPRQRRITVDRQVIETCSALKVALPKGRRLRVTMYPAATPAGLDLAELLERRLAELGDGDLVFPVPQGAFLRRSNYGRNIWDPAATSVGWPRHNRRWAWTFHSLRHVFATCALNPTWTAPRRRFPPLRSQPTRVTQDVYIHVHGDLYQRFYDATA